MSEKRISTDERKKERLVERKGDGTIDGSIKPPRMVRKPGPAKPKGKPAKKK